MQVIATHTRQLPDTTAWLLAALLLLSLLGLGSLVRPAAQAQSPLTTHPASPGSAHIIPSSWRSPTP